MNDLVQIDGLVCSVHRPDQTAEHALLRTARGLLRIRIALNVLPGSIRCGEYWHFEGHSTEMAEYGEVWTVCAGRRGLPKGAQTVPYLCHHVAGLVECRANRWIEQWPDNFHEALLYQEPATLSDALGGSSFSNLAREAIRVWQLHTLTVQISNRIGEFDPGDKIATNLAKFYGSSALERLQADPYVLLAFAPFSKVDSIADMLGVPKSDLRRLLGAVDAAIYGAVDRGQDAISDATLRSELTRLLVECDDAISVAIQAAQEAGTIATDGKGYWLGEGIVQVLAFINKELRRLSVQGAMPQANDIQRVKNQLEDYWNSPDKIIRLNVSGMTELETTLSEFLKFGTRDGVPIHLIAGSERLAQSLMSKFSCNVRTSLRCSELRSDDATQLSKTVVWISSLRCIRALARVLASVSRNDRLLILETSDSVGKVNRVGSIFTAGNCQSSKKSRVDQPFPYDSRLSGATGTFVVRVARHLVEQAVVGLANHHTKCEKVALIVPDESERRSILKRWHDEMDQAGAHDQISRLVSESTRDFELWDVSTLIHVIPNTQTLSNDWQYSLGIAMSRTIFVTDLEQSLDCISNHDDHLDALFRFNHLRVTSNYSES